MNEYMDRALLHGNLETLVLAVLARRSMHGYALRWLLAESSRGAIQVSFGRLYPLLDILQRTGLAKRTFVMAGEHRVRHVYSITPRGRAELARRALKWRRFARAMDQLLPP